ncbi:YncE family protein [Rhodanobacter geophilus]|uniref:YncE family protein n=1 Tax=Rhodanobacter geophilus TaxID=3162488 RepID=A0ABV3QTK3_9GAMM
MAHHTNYAEPGDDMLYANDWLANRTDVFDLRQPKHPRLARSLGSVGDLSYPHSFVTLADGNTLATFQYSGGFNHAAGGLVEFDPQGRVVRSASARVPGHPNVRPYSLAVVASADRVVTGSADMMGAQVSHVVQVWRLSDLKLLQTLPLPHEPDWIYDTAADSSEPRVLADGKTVLVPTFNCGLFLLKHPAVAQPTLQHVYDLGYRMCEVPVVAGDFLVETMQSGHAIVSLDVHDPEHPREVSRILLPPDEYPHWLALEPGGDRLAITGYGALATRVRFARVDRRTGTLQLEPAMTIDLSHAPPGSWHGSAMPHGVVFSRP